MGGAFWIGQGGRLGVGHKVRLIQMEDGIRWRRYEGVLCVGEEQHARITTEIVILLKGVCVYRSCPCLRGNWNGSTPRLP